MTRMSWAVWAAGGLELACSVGSVGGRAPRFRSGGGWWQRPGVASLARQGQAYYSRDEVPGLQAQSPSWRGPEALGPQLTWGVYAAPRLSLLAHSLPRGSGATRVPPQLPPLDHPGALRAAGVEQGGRRNAQISNSWGGRVQVGTLQHHPPVPLPRCRNF